MMQQMLKDAQAARASKVAIDGLEHSDQLTQQLHTFSSDMETAYKKLQGKVRQGKNSVADYAELPVIQKQLDWYADQKGFAKSVERRATSAGGGKAKKKAKAKAS